MARKVAKQPIAIEDTIVYFTDTKRWRENTNKVVELVAREVCDEGISTVVVASSRGYTAVKLADALDLSQTKLIAVKMAKPIDDIYKVRFPEQRRRALLDKGVLIIGGTHALTGATDHAFAGKFKGIVPSTLVAETLYLFCQGMKVCIEVVLMAVDAGVLPAGERVISIAGTGYGADTAIVVKSAGSAYLFDIEIQKVLCMPLSK